MSLGRGGLRPVAVAVLTLLAACASLPPGTPGPYDGTYAGSTRLVGFSSPDWQCDWQAPQLTVRDSRFSADIDGASMTVAIAPDGTFDHYAARPIYAETKYLTPVHIFGRIVDGTMDATVRQPRCTFKLTLGRQ